MATESTRRCELAKFVTNHRLSNIYRHVLTTVMNGNSVTNHFWEDG